jgi:hypothetical protein
MNLDTLEVVVQGRDYVVKVPFKEGRVYFHFSEISRSHQSFSTQVLTVVESTKEGIVDEYRQRLDLLSHSGVETFRRSLQNAFLEVKEIKWAIVINKAINAIVTRFNEAQKPVNFAGRECEASTFLLHPFLQKDANNMVFGDSEVGKSYFCLRMAASLAAGVPFLGFESDGGKNTLFLDYEDSDSVFNRRLHEVAAGLGISKDILDSHIWWYKPDGSMRDLGEVVSRMVEDYHIDLIVIDAGSNAAGGSPNDEQKVVEMFNALEQIPCTKLIIHHEPKDNTAKADNKAYYGTVFWRALTRIAWRLSVENEERGKLIKAVIAKKSNMGNIDPFYYRQSWEIGELGQNFGPVTLVREELKPKTGAEKIKEVLEEHGELNRTQIIEMTGMSINYFKELSQKMREQKELKIKGSGRGAVWYLPPIPHTPPETD